MLQEFMFRTFYPKEYVDSTYIIDFDEFAKKGFKGIIFDIDNTLVPHGAPADERAKKLFAHLKKLGMEACLLSNNKEPRVQMFNKDIGVHMIHKGGKPNPKGYRRAMELMGTDEQTTLFVGDQLFTDVWGANLTGLYSVLVKPMNPKEEIQIVLKRYLEKVVLFFYLREQKKRP